MTNLLYALLIVQNLGEQFMKKANFYFLIIAILSTTNFSPKSPWVSIIPLVFVLSVTAVKEALEDYVRELYAQLLPYPTLSDFSFSVDINKM